MLLHAGCGSLKHSFPSSVSLAVRLGEDEAAVTFLWCVVRSRGDVGCVEPDCHTEPVLAALRRAYAQRSASRPLRVALERGQTGEGFLFAQDFKKKKNVMTVSLEEKQHTEHFETT